MKYSARRQSLRALLAGDCCIYPASVHDPVSARIAQGLGFEAAIMAGSIASLAVLGAPDLILLTLSEFAEQARRITRASDIPLVVDADHGYGNALNVMRTVEEMENAGVSGMTIEDTLLPRVFGHPERLTLISVEEGIGKMRAALKARSDPDFVIIGRTSALGLTGIGDAIARCRAYQGAGVDAIFVTDLDTQKDLETFAGAISVPLIIGGSKVGTDDPKQLAEKGVRVVVQPHLPFAAAAHAIRQTMESLRQGIPPSRLAQAIPPDLMKIVSKDEEYHELTNAFLRKDPVS